MSTTSRHYFALMRKNYINWKREGCSSVVQLVCPGLLMLMLVWIRSLITPSELDAHALFLLEVPQYTVTLDSLGALDIAGTNTRLEAFSNYYQYPIDVTTDSQSPLEFNPVSCMLNNSWVLPRVASNIIALVGVTDNAVMQNIEATMTAYQEYWQANAVNNLTVQNFESLDVLQNYIESEQYLSPDNGICFGIQVTQDATTGDYSANLIMDDQNQYGGANTINIPPTNAPAYDDYTTQPNIDDFKILTKRGYTFAQNIVANAILQTETGDQQATIDIMNIPVPADALFSDPFQQILSSLFPFFLVLVFLLPVYQVTYALVREKEQRSKESMRMMGMTDLSYWLSWFSFYMIQNSIISILAWGALSINVINGGAVYIFLYIWLFGFSIFGQIVFYQAIFQRAKYAGLVSCLIFFMLQFLNTPIATGGSYDAKFLLSLYAPQVCISQMAVVWSDFESQQVGITPSTVNSQIRNFSFSEGLWILFFSGCLWMLLGFYCDAVFPKQFGSRKSACFCLKPSTYEGCCGKRTEAQEEQDEERRSTLLQKDYEDGGSMELKNLKKENYEPVSAEVARQGLDGQYLRIEGLEKTYDDGFHAVKGLNIKIYKNQIFALLGQNGAGKSTTISMLTGLIEASKGSAVCFGNDMFKSRDKVRQYMGICPQHDVLFENLSPIEHLQVFYDFKGGDPDKAKKEREIQELIKDVGLTADQNKKAGSLSGGNKRKLSVAIALCGNSKLIMLDEPTAGMDLGARRDLWTMLKNYRQDRIIILTTHYMDEADVLGDRIGIMAQGQMMCLGTSLFLKKRFGAGYKFTMVKQNKAKNTLIEPYLRNHFGLSDFQKIEGESSSKKIQLLSEVSSEITFQVSTELSQQFKTFFRDFDNDMLRLGVVSYGVSITTLEEVFLKINQEFKINIGNSSIEDKLTEQTGQRVEDASQLRATVEDSEEQLSVEAQRINLTDQEIGISEKEQAPQRLVGADNSELRSIKALLVKRFHLYKRDRTGLICEVVVPFVCVLIGCIASKINFNQVSYTIAVEPSVYPTPQRIVLNTNIVQSSANPVDPYQFYLNLPNALSDFEVTNYDQPNNLALYYEFVYAQRNVGPTNPYRYGSYQMYVAENSATNHTFQFANFLNLTSPMVAGYYPQFMYESVIKTATGKSFSLSTVPYGRMYQLSARSDSNSSFLYSGYVGFALCFMPCAMISFILIERVENLRHMQLISGMSKAAYWTSNMIADIIKLYIPIFIILIFSVMFGANYPGVWVLFLLWPLAIVPWTYVVSFLFEKDSAAQISTLMANYVVCCILTIVIYALQFIPQTFAAGDAMRWIFCIFPSFCVTQGIVWSANGSIVLLIRQQYPDAKQISPGNFSLDNLGGDALILILHFVIDSLILIAIEYELFACLKKFSFKPIPEPIRDLQLDSDVVAEEQRIANKHDEVIRVANFRKAYTTWFGEPFLAVERIGFGLDYGECFALLGVNGAGKSTTFKSLTADTTPTTGEITIGGFNIESQFEQARKMIGYCPQKDAIFNLMTVEEHLWFYVRIKGIPENLHEKLVNDAIVELNLSAYRDKPAGALSGGNKRKLSVAMALLGNPPIILLDEPSAGMDPEARRFMWTVVEKISQRDKQSAVILTTHSMEEAEALSTKMGIMVRGGVFKCFGSSQHIKNKFGTGYECEVKIRKPLYSELESLAQSLNISESIDQRVNLDSIKSQALKNNAGEMIIEQIKVGGLGSDLIFEAQQTLGTVRLANFITFIFIMQNGIKVTKLLTREFDQVELIEQCSDFFKFRFERQNKTIGSLFGLIEDKKQEMNISEYSVNQTSLEQIFQTFASQSLITEKATLVFTMNGVGGLQLAEDRRSTLKKSRESNIE